MITPAPLTITASTNTKYYDSTPSAAASPTTSALCGGTTAIAGPPTLCGADMITGLMETYYSANASPSPITLAVSPGYTISDGNGGNNYSVFLKTNTGTINPAPVTTTGGSFSGTFDGLQHSPSTCTVTATIPPAPAGNNFIGAVTCTNSPAMVGPNSV